MQNYDYFIVINKNIVSNDLQYEMYFTFLLNFINFFDMNLNNYSQLIMNEMFYEFVYVKFVYYFFYVYFIWQVYFV